MTEQELTAPAPAPTPPRPPSLRRRATVGGVWTIGGFGGQKVFQLASNVILTRILFPEAFGLMALVNVFLIGLTMFSDVGIKPSIVQNRRGEDEAFLDTAWTIQIARGFALWAGACLLAWPASRIYGEPILFPLLSAVGATTAINGFASTALATAERRLQFGRLTAVQLGGQAASIILTVALAWQMRSVWALAIGAVIGAAINVGLGHWILPAHRHRIRIEPQAFQQMIHFGKWIFLTTLLSFLGSHGLRAIQGGLVSAETFGLIYIAGMLGWAFGDLTSRLISAIAMPVLSKIARDEPHRFARVLAGIRLRLLAGTIPAFIALSFGARWIIDLLYDDRYLAAGPYLAILALNGAATVLPMPYTTAFLAKGDSRTNFTISAVLAGFLISGLLIGFFTGGVIGMLAGMGVATVFYGFVVMGFAHRSGFLSLWMDVTALGVIIAAAVLEIVLYG